MQKTFTRRCLDRFTSIVILLLGCFILFALPSAKAQANLSIYVDGLTNSFDDWSWAARDLNNTSPTHSGGKSIRVTSKFWEAISFHNVDFDPGAYANFSFWAHGGSSGGQRFQVYAEYGSSAAPGYAVPGSATANTWQQFTVPLADLGITNIPNFNRISIQLRGDGTTNVFYLDDIQFTAKPLPTVVNVSINATQSLRTVDERHFGVNLAAWDNYFDPPNHTTTTALLQEMGCTLVRLPGGSLSDEYHWASNTTLTNTGQWAASFADMVRVITNTGAQAIITVNYGTGTPGEAAAWVRHANVTNHLGFRYWEIGNECYGTWETDTNIDPHSAYTYAVRAASYLAQMRAADPSIKIGVVSVPGENSYGNGYTNHPAYNARTSKTNYGWTPILLSTLKSLGVTPDFLVHHRYAEWTDQNNPSQSNDNDTLLLQSTGTWAVDAADLRQQIVDYFGPSGTNIQVVVTENNADSGAQGRQSTSLVNGLYYADSLGQLLKTEFNGFSWWDFRNGTDSGGFFGSAIYGWRSNGDLGMVNGLSTRYPTFYAAKLMQWFARPGDKILAAGSDYALLTTYAARRANGSVSLLAINKLGTTNLNAQLTLTGFTPLATATVRSFGMANDEAARTNAPAAAQDITTGSFATAGTNFAYNFPPYSLTLLSLAPAAPRLVAVPPTTGEIIFQLQGQASVPYVIQTSTNLLDWNSVATNTLTGSVLNLTNSAPLDSSLKFWRAVWQP